jgi:biotin transport system substrate-specific component
MLGMLIIYFWGIFQLSIIKGFDFAILKGLQPFIIGDFYKLILASILLPQIWKLTKNYK